MRFLVNHPGCLPSTRSISLPAACLGLPFMIAGVGHYAELRPRLNAYTDELARLVDGG